MNRQQRKSANADMVARVVDGLGPDKNVPDPSLGARAVANMAAVHVPSFCRDGYKNAYDLAAQARLGEPPPKAPGELRRFVDGVLRTLTGCPESDIYFLAVEVNGTESASMATFASYSGARPSAARRSCCRATATTSCALLSRHPARRPT